MVNWKFLRDIYFPWLSLICEKIPRELNIFIGGKNDKTWNEKLVSWINEISDDQIDWKFVSLLGLVVIVIGVIMILQWFNRSLPSTPENSIVHDNENGQMQMEYAELISKPLEINRMIEASRVLNFDTENCSQFYIVSVGINETENSSLQINEIFATAYSPDNDKIQCTAEFKSILDEIIDGIESQSKNSQGTMHQLEDSNLESHPRTPGSKIPLLRSRQR
ncbi:uncharacterized protein LOC135172717 [Diachasmimorpha longicaudata]|uniref:uncharacterized protein LOC135172717 n=1 Tax=Diachasmimorpha longicaudata TaxID=58733 RepID=UPI0030B910EE